MYNHEIFTRCQVRVSAKLGKSGKARNSLHPLKSQGKVREFSDKSGKSHGISLRLGNAQIACFLEMQLLGMLASQNFAGLSILTSEINPENFRSIS